MTLPLRGPFEAEQAGGLRRHLPVLTVLAGSLATIWPFVASIPILPPLGLMMLLGWRLARAELFRIWAPLPLGMVDDLLSGQPLGSAMLLWTSCFFVMDLIDQRLVFRDFWHDWLIASGAIGFCLVAGRLIAAPIGAHVDTVLVLQAVVSILLFPLVMRLCAWLDAKRLGA